MYAIVKIGRNQHKVKKNEILEIDLLKAEPGSEVEFNQVYGIVAPDKATFGTPLVKSAKVVATVIEHGRGKKVIIFKKKKTKFYEKTRGHRQDYTRIKIKEIVA